MLHSLHPFRDPFLTRKGGVSYFGAFGVEAGENLTIAFGRRKRGIWNSVAGRLFCNPAVQEAQDPCFQELSKTEAPRPCVCHIDSREVPRITSNFQRLQSLRQQRSTQRWRALLEIKSPRSTMKLPWQLIDVAPRLAC